MLNAINFIEFCKHLIILNLMPATHSKQIGSGRTRHWESCGILENICAEHFTGRQLHRQQVMVSRLDMKDASSQGQARITT